MLLRLAVREEEIYLLLDVVYPVLEGLLDESRVFASGDLWGESFLDLHRFNEIINRDFDVRRRRICYLLFLSRRRRWSRRRRVAFMHMHTGCMCICMCTLLLMLGNGPFPA